MCILPGLVRLNLGLGESLDDGQGVKWKIICVFIRGGGVSI